MEMYLINWKGIFVGYTYDELAVLTLKTYLREINEEDVEVSSCDAEDAPWRYICDFRTSDHLVALSKWYTKNFGYEYVTWKHIDFVDRDYVSSWCNYDFFRRFEEIYREVATTNICSDICDLITSVIK